jgi:hypothetical protein
MKLEEALPALRAGKKIRCSLNPVDAEFSYDSFGALLTNVNSRELESDNWSIVEEPATDEELAAAFEERARAIRNGEVCEQQDIANILAFAAANLELAAYMVRDRYVDPSWKVGK